MYEESMRLGALICHNELCDYSLKFQGVLSWRTKELRKHANLTYPNALTIVLMEC